MKKEMYEGHNLGLLDVICSYYPPMKLREGNVFTGDCLSTEGGGSGTRSLPGGEWVCLVPGPFLGGVGMFRVCGNVQGCSMSGEVGISKGRGYVQRGTHPLLRPSGDNHMYGQHVGSTHPTGMLSCYTFIQTGSIVLGTSVYKVKIIRFAQSFAFNFDGPNFLNLSSLTQ